MSNFAAFRRPMTIALALTSSIAIVACNNQTTPNAPTITRVSVTAPQTTLVVGAKTQATATATGTNSPSQAVTWTTSDSSVATVSSTGLITAVKVGTANIIATSRLAGYTNQAGVVAITVVAAGSTNPTVTKVDVTLTPATVAVGGTSKATATVTGTNSPAQTVTWTSSAPTVATVDATGNVKALTTGTADIIATSTVDGTQNGKATLTVTATAPTGTTAKINFQPASAAVPAGYTANTGAAYTVASMTGWITEASVGTATPVALDLTNNTRNRGAINGVTDPRQYTQINMQCNNQLTGNSCSGSSELRSGAFEYKVINGKYNVTVGVGEASTDVNSVMQINLESKTSNAVTVLSGFTPTATDKVQVKMATVTVTDGMLTVDAIGGNNTKLNFIDITPAN